MQRYKQGMWKGYHLSIEGIRKGDFFREKWYIKGWGVGPRGGASPYKHFLSTRPGGVWGFWSKVKTVIGENINARDHVNNALERVIESPNARDQIAFYAFHSGIWSY